MPRAAAANYATRGVVEQQAAVVVWCPQRRRAAESPVGMRETGVRRESGGDTMFLSVLELGRVKADVSDFSTR